MTYRYTLQTDSTPKGWVRTWTDAGTFSLDDLRWSHPTLEQLDHMDWAQITDDLRFYGVAGVFADVRIKREDAQPEHDDPFTVRHCLAWCESSGVDLNYIPEMVRYLEDDGPDSTMSWPTVARMIGARYTDGHEYR